MAKAFATPRDWRQWEKNSRKWEKSTESPARLAFIRVAFVWRGIAEWAASVDPVRWTLAICDLAHHSLPHPSQTWNPLFLALRITLISIEDPKGPKIEKIQDLEIFKRDWKFQAHCPPDPYFFVGNLGDWFLYTSSAGRCCPFAVFSASGV